MCVKYSGYFIIFITLIYILMLVMNSICFGVLSGSKFHEDAFWGTNNNYQEIKKVNFIMNLEFGDNLIDKDIFGKINSFNIYKWRNTTMKKEIKEFEINIFTDIISEDEKCPSGKTKCGKINDMYEYLCLKLDENGKCPINRIYIDENNISPTESYKTFQFGDKYIHYSNEENERNIIKNLNITETKLKTGIDKDDINNITEYNQETIPYVKGFVYLNRDILILPYKEDIENLKKKNNKNVDIYEMNSKFKGNSLYILSIIIFSLTIFIPLDIGLYFLLKEFKCGSLWGKDGDNCEDAFCRDCNNEEDCRRCLSCFILVLIFGLPWLFFRYNCSLCFNRELDQKKIYFLLYYLFMPVFFFSIISLIIVSIRKYYYLDYMSLDFIYEIKNGNVLDSYNSDINLVLATSIINVSIFIFYPIIYYLVIKCKSPKYDNNSLLYNTKK